MKFFVKLLESINSNNLEKQIKELKNDNAELKTMIKRLSEKQNVKFENNTKEIKVILDNQYNAYLNALNNTFENNGNYIRL